MCVKIFTTISMIRRKKNNYITSKHFATSCSVKKIFTEHKTSENFSVKKKPIKHTNKMIIEK